MLNSNNYSVLYVEDELEIRTRYSLYLQRFFKNVYEASDGESAYQIYKEKRPDILVIDVNLPGMSGLELLRKIREQDHNTKAIMLTAHAEAKYLLDSIELKLTKYLIKPISREALQDALEMAIKELLKFNSYSKKMLQIEGDYYWDCVAKELHHDGLFITLTKNETELFSILALRPNQTLLYDDICYALWPNDINDKQSALKTLIKGLRKKIPEMAIENIRSAGYKLKTI